MNHDLPENAILARLEKVEAQYRRMRSLSICLVVFSAVALWTATTGSLLPLPLRAQDVPEIRPRRGEVPLAATQQQVVEDTIRARHISLVDSRGAERLSLATDGAGSVFLVLFDKEGKSRTTLQVNNFGPSLNFYDASGRSRMILGSTNLVASRVASGDGQVERQTPSSLVLFDSGGKLLWRAP